MKVIALTGGIATGKSLVARAFEQLGAVVIDADKIAHRVYLPKTPFYRALLRRYGRRILAPNQGIDRKKLAKILFRSKAERLWVEAHVHPETRRLIGQEVQKALRRGTKLVLVEAALHVETDYHRGFHGLIVVHTKPGIQMKRLRAREGWTAQQARQAIRSQMPQHRKRRAADWLIDNSGTRRATMAQVRKLFRTILKSAKEG